MEEVEERRRDHHSDREGTGKGQENINITNEEVEIITGTKKSQESIGTATAGAVVIIMQERMEGVNIIHAGEIKN